MDEPFGSLDAQSRDNLHTELQAIWSSTRKTVLFVTHNVREAIVLGDRVVVFSSRPGKVKRIFAIQLPRPREIESYAVVDLAREILQVLQDDGVSSARPAESARLGIAGNARAQAYAGASFGEVGDDVL
jgi:NitT/TauT family transport system ATP-binding protein